MSVLKILNDYYNTDAPEKIVDYIIRKAVFKDTFALDLNHAAEQIHAVKSFWCEIGGRQMVHFILAFDDYENVSLSNDEIIQIAERFCGLFYGRFQIVYGVHFDSGNIHIHFAMNNVSYIDRKRYLSNRYDNLVLAGSIESITGRTVILRQHRTIKRKQISDTKRWQI